MKLETLVPIAKMYLTPEDMSDSFPLIWTIFNQFKAEVLYAESSFQVSGDKGITLLIVYTKCNKEVEDPLDAYLIKSNLGNYDGHKLRFTSTGKEIHAVRWIVKVMEDRVNESQ